MVDVAIKPKKLLMWPLAESMIKKHQMAWDAINNVGL